MQNKIVGPLTKKKKKRTSQRLPSIKPNVGPYTSDSSEIGVWMGHWVD